MFYVSKIQKFLDYIDLIRDFIFALLSIFIGHTILNNI
nr:MAG TPA: hypothetical protein [Caudoviricetes sp.]